MRQMSLEISGTAVRPTYFGSTIMGIFHTFICDENFGINRTVVPELPKLRFGDLYEFHFSSNESPL